MEKLEKRYRSLRIIAWLFKFGAWVSFVCGFVMFFAILFGGKVLFHFVEGSAAYMQYVEFGRTFGSVIVLGGFLLNALFLYAVSSSVYLFIDIESNTRRIALLLSERAVGSSHGPSIPAPPDDRVDAS